MGSTGNFITVVAGAVVAGSCSPENREGVMRKILGIVGLLSLLASPALAAPNAADPCGQAIGDGGYKAVSAPIAISSSTATTQIVGLSSGLKIYACAWNFSISGTTPTYQWSYGTGTNCGTGNTVLTGATAMTSGAIAQSLPFEGTQLVVPAGNALCLTLAGTTPSALGYLSYRQGP